MNNAPVPTNISTLAHKSEQQELAAFALDPLNHAALSLEQCSGLAVHQELGFAALAERLSEVTKSIHDGDTKQLQAMLFAQSIVLDSIFQNLLRRSLETNFGGVKEPMLRLALQAQKQSRQTLTVLNDISQPNKASVLIQNNNALNQQINNNNPNKLINMETANG